METYFVCSEAIIKAFPDVKKSKSFKSGYDWEDDNYYVALLDFDQVEKHYNSLSEESQDEFWCRECVPGQMDVSKITISGAKKYGLFREIEMKIGLTSEHNRAMTIHNLAERFNCTPIEFINKLR